MDFLVHCLPLTSQASAALTPVVLPQKNKQHHESLIGVKRLMMSRVPEAGFIMRSRQIGDNM